MRPYIPHTEQDERQMLQTIGVHTIDELFQDIPANLRIQGELDTLGSLDEHRLLGKLFELSRENKNCLSDLVCFLGAGMYDRYIPATVGAMISRGEFLTAYTPYQPEFSQGYLQTIFEFQTMIAELYGCDIANASMYDGGTAMAEAAILAYGLNGRTQIAVSEGVHPHYRQVLETYCWSMGLTVLTIPTTGFESNDWSLLTEECACLILQTPNFFGTIEDVELARKAADRAGCMLIAVSDPIACALIEPPGKLGADIVVGEGQPLGIAMGFGGPALGLFACREEFVRRIPGRIVGRTNDANNNPGYVMTLRTREQDIRREKATSNICTNEALMALAATVYLSSVGRVGLQQIAESSVRNTQYAMQAFTAAGARVVNNGRVFCEFVLDVGRDAVQVRDALMAQGFLAGLPLGDYVSDGKDYLLVAVTETRSKEQIDSFVAALKGV